MLYQGKCEMYESNHSSCWHKLYGDSWPYNTVLVSMWKLTISLIILMLFTLVPEMIINITNA